MRILLPGGYGLIGTNIIPFLSKFYECIPFRHEEWDITDEKKGSEIIRSLRPDLVINLAAKTDVDGCEDDVEVAEKVNAYGAGCLAKLCAQFGIRLVHFSTDYVFDGTKGNLYTEEDDPCPISAYGRTKYEGEKRVLSLHPCPLIIRTQWIYGRGGRNFVDRILELSMKEDEIRVVSDQFGSPTYAKDLGEPLKLLIEKRKTGIYNVVNSGVCSWYEFAEEIVKLRKINVKIVPFSSSETGRKAKRPQFSALSTEKLKHELGYQMRNWKEALREYLNFK